MSREPTEMEKRVAKAIVAALEKCGGHVKRYEDGDVVIDTWLGPGEIEEVAADVIRGMREPTEAMCQKVVGRFMHPPPAAQRCWEAMIDAASPG